MELQHAPSLSLKADESCRDDVQENGLDGRGWVAVEDEGIWRRDPDLTWPIAWAVGV
ncbi:hypothetical protein [Methylobacterium sp. Leaf94]|uniref:hypothetical protein n=1 Tax=Methylobacterium sp. Leaf94 TaxID=1736250 RepID=UPI000B1364EC|nr:hypothetical protein [Methylobacterium sp. Leaf94]